MIINHIQLWTIASIDTIFPIWFVLCLNHIYLDKRDDWAELPTTIKDSSTQCSGYCAPEHHGVTSLHLTADGVLFISTSKDGGYDSKEVVNDTGQHHFEVVIPPGRDSREQRKPRQVSVQIASSDRKRISGSEEVVRNCHKIRKKRIILSCCGTNSLHGDLIESFGLISCSQS